MNSTEPLYEGAPIWLTLPFALIAVGVVFALLVLFWGARLAGRRRRARAEIEEYNEEYREETPAKPISPPVAPPPPPIAEAPLAPPPAPEPTPIAEAPAPEPVAEPEIVPAPLPPVVEEAPVSEPLADEPIAAAAPLDASPASLASDIAEPAPEPEPEPEPAAAAPEPAPVATPAAPKADDLTRMKGVGPRLAERLASVGITSFAQLAALTPEEANALDAKLGDFQGRIHRDRWIEQASFLAKEDIAGFEGVFGKL